MRSPGAAGAGNSAAAASRASPKATFCAPYPPPLPKGLCSLLISAFVVQNTVSRHARRLGQSSAAPCGDPSATFKITGSCLVARKKSEEVIARDRGGGLVAEGMCVDHIVVEKGAVQHHGYSAMIVVDGDEIRRDGTRNNTQELPERFGLAEGDTAGSADLADGSTSSRHPTPRRSVTRKKRSFLSFRNRFFVCAARNLATQHLRLSDGEQRRMLHGGRSDAQLVEQGEQVVCRFSAYPGPSWMQRSKRHKADTASRKGRRA